MRLPLDGSRGHVVHVPAGDDLGERSRAAAAAEQFADLVLVLRFLPLGRLQGARRGEVPPGELTADADVTVLKRRVQPSQRGARRGPPVDLGRLPAVDALKEPDRLAAHGEQIPLGGVVEGELVNAELAGAGEEQARHVTRRHLHDVHLPQQLTAVVHRDHVSAVVAPPVVAAAGLAFQHGQVLDIEHAIALDDAAAGSVLNEPVRRG